MKKLWLGCRGIFLILVAILGAYNIGKMMIWADHLGKYWLLIAVFLFFIALIISILIASIVDRWNEEIANES